jgi:hypothetical protein
MNLQHCQKIYGCRTPNGAPKHEVGGTLRLRNLYKKAPEKLVFPKRFVGQKQCLGLSGEKSLPLLLFMLPY